MNFKWHGDLEGKHAFLSASKYHWVNYDEEKIATSYLKHLAVQNGTEMHELAAKLIEKRVKLPKTKTTFNMYVNDAIGYGMTPEQVLFYSYNCFGTADAISFKKNFLRIHDLKTGEVPAHIEQLYIYASLFCLEYDVRPGDIEIECRIYQNDDVIVAHPGADDILPIMDKIKTADKILSSIQSGE